MSKLIYTYDKCYQIAQLCSSASEMKKMNGSAYNVANRQKWIKDYYWFRRKQHTPYTYDEVFEIAKQYKCSSDFQKGNGSAYGKARANGWIKDYTWFTIKQHAPYTYEDCYEIALNFESRVALARGNVGVYQAALNHGWLDDYTWFKSKQKPYNYWTKDRVTNEAKKYKSRGEFHDNNGTAYSKARINGWLDDFTWLKDERIDISKDKVDCVYSYEFESLKAVYIGRTLMRRAHIRDKEHIFVENDSVYLFARKNHLSVPKIKILENNLTIAEGVEKEGYYIEVYKSNGWKIINRAKSGSIGKIGSNKWTKETCYEEALKYQTRGEFASLCGSAYEVSRRNGWLEEYIWFKEMQKPCGYWDSYENCYNAAQTCKRVSEFVKKFNAAYVSARKHGWIKEYTWFETKRTAHNKKWFYDNTLEEAQKYNTRTEFARKAHGAYKAAVANKWLDEFFPK